MDSSPHSGDDEHLFRDRFYGCIGAGNVIGKIGTDGVVRKGIDKEGVISIDNGALRIQPLIRPGWGRAGIAYGPYKRQPGLAMVVSILNGHNTSQAAGLGQHPVERLKDWMRGSGSSSVEQRIISWLKSRRKRRTIRMFRQWLALAWRSWRGTTIVLDENLAIGWFKDEIPAAPLLEGNCLIMHATGAENGELWGRIGGQTLPLVQGVQNIPLHYVVVLREKGAIFYAAALPGAHNIPAPPYMRPLAVNPFDDKAILFAAIYQSVLGQIGFRVDTRVNEVLVGYIPSLSNWYNTAHAADHLQGSGELIGSQAEVGGNWSIYSGRFLRSISGARAQESHNLAVVHPPEPSGLVNVMVETDARSEGGVGLVWRFSDVDNCWCCQVGFDECRLMLRRGGQITLIATDAGVQLRPHSCHALQVIDDGQTMRLSLNGRVVFRNVIDDSRLNDCTGVGIEATSSNFSIHSLEAHPRRVPLPAEIDLEPAWRFPEEKIVVVDDFLGRAGDLAGQITSVGGNIWRRTIGTGVIDLTGDGVARILASKQKPNPGRTAYTFDWDQASFADVEVEITPPGSRRGERETGRAGLILYQDPSNYVILNTWLDDAYDGASVSTFYQLDDFEEIYDAVWTNVGRRIYWGVPYKLRVVLDGLSLIAFVDDEAVLFRNLTDVYPEIQHFHIRQVGLAINWEWGNDSGSIFKDFVARAKV